MKPLTRLRPRNSSSVDTNSTGEGRELDRIIFFTDAIFAIAVTLLVLDIRLPDILPELVATALPAALAALWPKFLSFIVSFAVIGVYGWQVHHSLFRYIIKYDEHLLGLNLFLLLCVAFLPFSTSLIGQYGAAQIALIIYLANLCMVSLLLAALLGYAMQYKLTDGSLTMSALLSLLSRILTLPTFCVLAFVFSFISPYFWLFALVLLFPIRIILMRLVVQFFGVTPQQDSRADRP